MNSGDAVWVLADNLFIEKVTIVESGNGHGMSAYVKRLTGSMITIFEEIKNAMGLNMPDITRMSKNPD